MTNNEKISAIENKIREECNWLLKDGCESGLPVEECIKKYDCRYCYWGNQYFPTQLSDLLYVIQKKWQFNSFAKGYELYPVFRIEKHEYDLTKSFKENLESSEELTEFLFNLIVK